MQQHSNAHGLAFTSGSDRSVVAFDRVVMDFLAFSVQTGASMKALLSEDTDMPMARCLYGYFMMLMGVRSLIGRAQKNVQWLEESQGGLNAREQMHAEALSAWISHSLGHATKIWCGIAKTYPRDVLAVKMAHFGYFYQGDSRGLRDVAAASLDFWNEVDNVRPYIMNMYAFGLEECGSPWEAEAVGRDALSQQPNDPWGIHVVAHAMEATGQTSQGIAFIESMQSSWNSINNFRYHIAWHKALFRFDAGQYGEALADYDQFVFSDTATEYLDICNDASLLFRLELAGVDVGNRWADVADKVQSRTQERILAFADLHYVLALTSSPNETHKDLARSMVEAFEAHAKSPANDSAAYQAAIPAAQSILAFRNERYPDATAMLTRALPNLFLVGGSNAQRDMFACLLAESVSRSDEDVQTTATLLAARSHSHPHNSHHWQLYLSALEKCDDMPTLERAKIRRRQWQENKKVPSNQRSESPS